MDLLMHLLEKNKIDIFDIPIVTITDQYLEYVRQMEKSDMNVTSSFLVMASTLLDIKSRMLLPRESGEEEEEEDPRDELVRRLLEYKMYKSASEELRVRSVEAGQQFFRQQDLPQEVLHYVPPIQYEELIGDTTMENLKTVFTEVLRRKKSRVDPIRSGFREIPKEEISTADKELYIRAYLKVHPKTDFRALLEAENNREDVIVTFLVVLELMKLQVIHITQEEIGGPIYIEAGKAEAPVEEAAEPAQPAEEPAEPEQPAEEPAEPAQPAEEPTEPEQPAQVPEEETEEEPVSIPAAAPSQVVASALVRVEEEPEPVTEPEEPAEPEPVAVAESAEPEAEPEPESRRKDTSGPAWRRRISAARSCTAAERRQALRARRLRAGFWKRRKRLKRERQDRH